MDQTGGFPVTSSCGNKYVMVMCKVDGNYINGKPMKSKTTESMIETYLKLWKRMTNTKIITPKLHILDNAAPEALREVIKTNCKMQLVPPNTHQRNLAERVIQTSLHRNLVRCQQKLPNSTLGSSHPTSSTNIKLVASIPC
jgi:hypothetical protein